MSMKINKLEIENVKRVKAVKIEPSPSGLTIIGGNNNQGKTSILDAIAWALGGNKYRPSQAQREGSYTPLNLHIVMSNGLVVERKGKNSDLKVIDPNGNKAGQQLLNSFVEELALDLPKFMESSNKDKADTLLQIIGVGKQLAQLELSESDIYNQRRTIGQIADQKKKFAQEQAYFPDAPKEPISASKIIAEQQTILARNGENQRKRENLRQIEMESNRLGQTIQAKEIELANLKQQAATMAADLEIARKTALDLHDESTDQLEDSISNIEEINRKVRANLDKDKAEQDAQGYADNYAKLTMQLDSVRLQKSDLLKTAKLPLPGLSVADGELIYNGQKWDNMSGSDQLKVSTAIVRQLKPDCGFVLLDKLEQMDLQTLNDFGEWLKGEDLQAIATRVSTGQECSIIIEDGYSTQPGQPAMQAPAQTPAEAKTWKKGEF